MAFFVDLVTEDSFYENLTLGVVRILEASPCVKNVRVDRRNGCEESAIVSWEQRHGCQLPEDLRNFYAAIDGFLLTWSLEIAGEEFPVGCMEIGSLHCLKRFPSPDRAMGTTVEPDRGTATRTGSERAMATRTGSERAMTSTIEPNRALAAPERAVASTIQPNSGMATGIEPEAEVSGPRGSRSFELGRCSLEEGCGQSRVVLVIPRRSEGAWPSVWLRPNNGGAWFKLSDSFSGYFRQMLTHLGLPGWQRKMAGLPVPTWARQVYLLVAPHLLEYEEWGMGRDRGREEKGEERGEGLWRNTLDPGIFRGREGRVRRKK